MTVKLNNLSNINPQKNNGYLTKFTIDCFNLKFNN